MPEHARSPRVYESWQERECLAQKEKKRAKKLVSFDPLVAKHELGLAVAGRFYQLTRLSLLPSLPSPPSLSLSLSATQKSIVHTESTCALLLFLPINEAVI